MLRSTIEKILPQLDPIADKLGIGAMYRDAYFRTIEVSLCHFEVLVSLGEIHTGTGHQLAFETNGKLLRCHHEWWDSDGHIRSEPVSEALFEGLVGIGSRLNERM